MGRSSDDEIARIGPFGSQKLDERKPVQARHTQISRDHFVGSLAGHRERVSANFRGVHAVAKRARRIGEGLPGGGVVVHIKDMSLGVLRGPCLP